MWKKYSFKSLCIVLLAIAVVTVVCLPTAFRQGGTFIAPYNWFGESMLMNTATLSALSIPVLAILAIVFLVRFQPRPSSAIASLVILMIGVLHFFTWGSFSEFYGFAQVLSPLLFATSVATAAEIAIRKLSNHVWTAICILFLSFAYWNCALVLAIVVG